MENLLSLERKGKEIIIKFLGLNSKFKLILIKEVYSYHQQICLYLNQHQLPRNLPQISSKHDHMMKENQLQSKKTVIT